MNYYLIDTENQDVRLRQYRNTRVAEYTVSELNAAAGYSRYTYVADDHPTITVRTSNCGFEVDFV